jgi:hypothetical protein
MVSVVTLGNSATRTGELIREAINVPGAHPPQGSLAAGTGLWVGLVCWLNLSGGLLEAHAGDRVVFSKPTNSIESPTNVGKSTVLPDTSSVLPRPSSTPTGLESVPGTVEVPNIIANRNLQEMLDRHRNWAFMTPETAFVKSPGLDVDAEAVLSKRDQAPRRAIESYLDRQNQINPAAALLNKQRPVNPATVSTSATASISQDLRNEMTRPTGSEGILDHAVSIGSFSTSSDRLNSPSTSSSALAPLVYPTTSTSSQDVTRNEQLGSAIKPKRSLATLPDPINLLPDLTSESIQPVIGQSKSDAGPTMGLGFNNLDSRPDRSRREDTLTSRILGPSSLAPAIAPIEPARATLPPPVLEIPKRRF